jgi:hypothetical protein
MTAVVVSLDNNCFICARQGPRPLTTQVRGYRTCSIPSLRGCGRGLLYIVGEPSYDMLVEREADQAVRLGAPVLGVGRLSF